MKANFQDIIQQNEKTIIRRIKKEKNITTYILIRHIYGPSILYIFVSNISTYLL